ncbi:MAG: TonB-system energizer ExbB [Thermodesulfovibrionales bacterium]|nr:TonB-system energizer ExbB [Thermodesulfovibrionales bacterium]
MEMIKVSIDYGIIGMLLVMSVVALAIAIERFSFIRHFDLSEATKRFKTREEVETELTKKLHIIASIGSNAPYIGLLGTVLGIMLTFYEMGQGSMHVKNIMVGLSLALKATAMGLLVAIPCVFLNNILLRKIREKLTDFTAELRRTENGA